MKSILNLFILSLVFFTTNSIFAQQTNKIKAGAHFALPISGDVSKAYQYNIAFDISYFYSVSDKVDIGLSSGFNYLSGKTVKYIDQGGKKKSYTFDDGGYIPVLASGIFHFNDKICLWLDEGVGIFPKKGEKAAYTYERKIGFSPIPKVTALLGYKGFSRNGLSAGAFMIGGRYNLGAN